MSFKTDNGSSQGTSVAAMNREKTADENKGVKHWEIIYSFHNGFCVDSFLYMQSSHLFSVKVHTQLQST